MRISLAPVCLSCHAGHDPDDSPRRNRRYGGRQGIEWTVEIALVRPLPGEVDPHFAMRAGVLGFAVLGRSRRARRILHVQGDYCVQKTVTDLNESFMGILLFITVPPKNRRPHLQS